MHAQTGSTKISEDAIIAFLYEKNSSATLDQIREGIGLARIYRKELQYVLQALCSIDRLSLYKGKKYQLLHSKDIVDGVLSKHPRGFAFVRLSAPYDGAKGEEEVFLPASALKTANHGDRVLVQITGLRRKGLEGRVVQVLARSLSRLVGIYTAGRTTGLVAPEDDRFPFSILIRKEQSCGAKNGQAVVAELTEYKEGQRNPGGRILEVLGDPEDLQVQTDIVIRNFELPYEFDEQAMEETGRLDDRIAPEPGRTDLRDVLHVTIDGESARDFDDAVSVVKTRHGYRLYVSIADVSHYVVPGSAIDREAYLRGTSVYFPTRVVPMLPERLSNHLCSLVPDVDRFAFSAILDFDRTGKLKKKQFTKSLIRSRYRLTYTVVQRILGDRDTELRREYKPILTMLNGMFELSALLEKRRMARGSIGFEIPEPIFSLSADGMVEAITRSERNLAHKLIEEFMLAANEAVAETFAAAGRNHDTLYRIHESPDPVKVAEFAEFAKSMGLVLKTVDGTPEWFGGVLKKVVGSPQEYIVNNLLLRIMKQACYSPENAGHFGLAAPYYTHFTSPIRRYPDLMVHRALAEFLEPSGKKGGKKAARGNTAADAGVFLSKRERVAIDAEREMAARLQVRYMAEKVGESFDGIVSGVAAFGMFIELLESFVSGAVAITDLKDDYYHFEEKAHRLIGKRTNRIYRIGDVVRVRVSGVDLRRKHINFVIEHGNKFA